MKNKKLVVLFSALFSVSTLTGFGLKDLTDKVKPNTDKCENKKNEKSCKNKERLKSAAKVAAIGIAAKVIYDMVVEYKSKNTENDRVVAKEYLKTNKELPDVATLLSYDASIVPGTAVQRGKKVLVKSAVTVVPSKGYKEALIEEKIDIFDNDDNTKVIKTLTKTVNGETKKAGTYENDFTFTLPPGMPEGVYPISTAVLVDGKAQPAKPNKMQVVIHVLPDMHYQIAYAN